jgi:hypothetical protein
MDGNVHPVSPSELYGRLGTASAPSLVDVFETRHSMRTTS